MPRGPQGQWRPAGTNECAAHVCRIATGEIEDSTEPPASERRAVPARAAGGKKGGAARAKALTPERRAEIARAGAGARWGH